MSNQEYRSFLEEKQEYFNCTFKSYNPLGYPEAGIRWELTAKRLHRICPYCGCFVTYVHEHKQRIIHAGSICSITCGKNQREVAQTKQ